MIFTNQTGLELSLASLALIVLVGIIAFRKGGIPYLVSKFEKSPPENTYLTAYYRQKVSLFEVLAGSPSETIFLGDSLTEQGEWGELLNNSQLKNRGISGDTTTGLLQRLNIDVASKPNKIFLMIGINDLLNERKPVSQIASNYRSILEKLKLAAPKTTVIIQSLLPVNKNLYKREVNTQDIVALNAQLQELANEFSFPYVDLHNKFSNTQHQLDSEYTLDGVHLNGLGYLLWRDVIERYVNES